MAPSRTLFITGLAVVSFGADAFLSPGPALTHRRPGSHRATSRPVRQLLQGESVGSAAEGAADNVGSTAEDAAGRVADAARGGAASTSKEAQDAAERVGSAAEVGAARTSKAAQRAASRVGSAVEDGAERTTREAQEAAARVGSAVEDGVDSASRSAQKAATRVESAVKDGAEGAAESAGKAVDRIADAAKERVEGSSQDPMGGASNVTLAASDRVSLGGVEVSPLGVGAWSWGDTLFWGYSEDMDRELQEVFNNCVGGGVNLFDTAEVYGLGRSEYLCGKFRREYEGDDKQGIVVASKFAPLPWRLSRRCVVDACKASLDRMGAESMEIYQIHWPFGGLSPKYWDGLADCVDQGLVKAVGVSNYGPDAVRAAHAALKERGVQLGSNQIQFSLANRKPETSGMLRLCEDLDVRVLAYSPLAQGLLTAKYSRNNMPSGPRARAFKKQLPKVEPLVLKLKEIAAKREKTPAQVSLNWCISKGTIPIPGAKNIKQAEENCGALGWRLSEEEVFALDSAAARL